MNKYLFLLFVLTSSCGAPPTNQESVIDRQFSDFRNDCRAIYDTNCNLPQTEIKVISNKELNETDSMCWTMDGNNVKFLNIKHSVIENKTVVYKEFFECFLKFNSNSSLQFDDFAHRLNLNTEELIKKEPLTEQD